MRILVAGAAGVLGSRVVRALAADGYEVVGTTRKPHRFAEIERSGGRAVLMDALDAASVQAVVREAAPDAIIHELTDLADADFTGNARLRVDGTKNLVDAALANDVETMVAQSIAWAYEPSDDFADESVPLAVDPETGEPAFPAINTLEREVRRMPRGVVLRLGLLYGPGTWYASDGAIADQARLGTVVATSAWTSFLHVDDAASATVLALDWPAGPVNIVDDEPTHVGEWAPAYIYAVGALSIASVTARGEGRSADNALARSRGWVPAHPSWRTSLIPPE